MQAEEIVEQFDEPVRRWFARRVTDPGDAEDLAQETIIAAMEAMPRFRGESSPRTWVYAIARNQLLKYLRGVRLRPIPLAWASDGPATGPDAQQSDHDITDRIVVDIILSRLPLNLRQVYRCFYCEGRSTAETARALERSQGTVKYQLYEIRRRVKRALGSPPTGASMHR
ncbi:MAG: RNA polymerase sigma factor [Spirochaetales bacterium]